MKFLVKCLIDHAAELPKCSGDCTTRVSGSLLNLPPGRCNDACIESEPGLSFSRNENWVSGRTVHPIRTSHLSQNQRDSGCENDQ